MFNQLFAVWWLKWRISRNSLRKQGRLFELIAAIALVAGAISMLLMFGAGVSAGFLVAPLITPARLLIIWDVLAAVYLVSMFFTVLTELQQSESISVQKFLHLPVSPFHGFLINFLTSFINFMTFVMVPPILGFCVTHVYAFGLPSLLSPLILISYIIMVIALVFQMRTLFTVIIINSRKQKMILAVVTMLILAVSQTPVILNATGYFDSPLSKEDKQAESINIKKLAEQLKAEEIDQEIYDLELARNKLNKDTRRSQRQTSIYQNFQLASYILPIGWGALGIQQLAVGNIYLAGLCTLGTWCVTSWSLLWSYRATMRLYRGELGQTNQPATSESEPSGPIDFGWGAKGFLWLDDRAAAVASATLGNLLRDTAGKLLVLAQFLLVCVVVGLAASAGNEMQHPDLRGLVAFAVGLIVVFAFAQLSQNQFAFDRHGFQAFVFSPIDRKSILLGKNMAPLPIAFAGVVVGLILYQIFIPVKVTYLLAALCAFFNYFLTSCIVSNYLSILFPYAFKEGTTQPQDMTIKIFLVQMVAMMVSGTLILPLILPVGVEFLVGTFLGWNLPLAFLGNLVLLAGLIWLYRQALKHQAQLLCSRESRIAEAIAPKGD